jgi:hypothetical protein
MIDRRSDGGLRVKGPEVIKVARRHEEFRLSVGYCLTQSLRKRLSKTTLDNMTLYDMDAAVMYKTLQGDDWTRLYLVPGPRMQVVFDQLPQETTISVMREYRRVFGCSPSGSITDLKQWEVKAILKEKFQWNSLGSQGAQGSMERAEIAKKMVFGSVELALDHQSIPKTRKERE